MKRSPGRPRNDRLRALRFALWAQDRSPSEITVHLISGLFDISYEAARQWRNDWLLAISPIEVEGVPVPLNVFARHSMPINGIPQGKTP
ncbi:MAG: hypothetical protein ACREPD_12990 [Stenotrophomonas sp.]|uniref:hypothetical protein n=1 Tax=Stenotrophomonas sp. TaxID=69392 RepID=UPI003D6D6F85